MYPVLALHIFWPLTELRFCSLGCITSWKVGGGTWETESEVWLGLCGLGTTGWQYTNFLVEGSEVSQWWFVPLNLAFWGEFE